MTSKFQVTMFCRRQSLAINPGARRSLITFFCKAKRCRHAWAFRLPEFSSARCPLADPTLLCGEGRSLAGIAWGALGAAEFCLEAARPALMDSRPKMQRLLRVSGTTLWAGSNLAAHSRPTSWCAEGCCDENLARDMEDEFKFNVLAVSVSGQASLFNLLHTKISSTNGFYT